MKPHAVRCCALLVAMIAPAVRAQTVVPGGLIEEDAVWTEAGSPYLIQDDVLLAPETTLEIEPGVEVRFLGNTRLVVSGTLLAEGTADSRVVFTSDDPGGNWQDILFSQLAPDASKLRFCTFQDGGVATERFYPPIEDCMFLDGSHVVPFPLGQRAEGTSVVRNTLFDSHELLVLTAPSVVFEGNVVRNEACQMWNLSTVNVVGNLFDSDSHVALSGIDRQPFDGRIANNVIVGVAGGLVDFVGEFSGNRVSTVEFQLHGAGAELWGNEFEIRFGEVGFGAGIRVEGARPQLTFSGNNITTTGEPGEGQCHS